MRDLRLIERPHVWTLSCEPMERPIQKLNDLSRSLTALEPDGTLIAVIAMSLSSWLVAGIVPGVERQPLKKLAVDESALLKLLHRWREEAEKAGRRIERIAVAFEAGRDGFWLARWLKARGIEAYVIHASSVACRVGPGHCPSGPALSLGVSFRSRRVNQ